MRALLVVLCAVLPALGFAQEPEKGKKSDISAYVVDIEAGAVSAAGMIGLDKTAIQQVQSSQDLVLALKPFTSGDSKSGFGLAITPARTDFVEFSTRDYYDKPLLRALTSLTFSYAQDKAAIAAVNYEKQGISADLFYYWDREKDPIVAAHKAFGRCNERPDIQGEHSKATSLLGRAIVARKKADESKVQADIDKAKAAEDAALKAYNAVVDKCLEEGSAAAGSKTLSPWNASRIGVSLGAGWIRPEDGSRSRESLGRAITFGGIWGASENGALYYSLRRTSKEVDLTTLAGTIQHRNSSLAAVRYVHGSKDDNGDTKLLAEVSNAKKNEVTIANTVFKYALGVDRKLSKGTWLQFRLGRNRTIDGTTTETTGLVNLTFAPSAGLFK